MFVTPHGILWKLSYSSPFPPSPCILVSSMRHNILNFRSLYLWLYWTYNCRIRNTSSEKVFLMAALTSKLELYTFSEKLLYFIHLLMHFKGQSLVYVLLNILKNFTWFWLAWLGSGKVQCKLYIACLWWCAAYVNCLIYVVCCNPNLISRHLPVSTYYNTW